MRSPEKQGVIHWIMTLFILLLLITGCVSSAFLIYGGGSWNSAAQWEAQSLASINLNELIGTADFQNSKARRPGSIVASAMRFVGTTFGRPLAMLQAQLPELSPHLPTSGQTQSSLIHSLTLWAGSSHRLSIGWIPSDTPARTIARIGQNPGLTAVSPAWLTVADAKGNVHSSVQSSVVTYAHHHGIKVWAMLDNAFSSKLTTQVLQSIPVRRHLEEQVVTDVVRDDLDGINVDFENVNPSDADALTAFIRELRAQMAPRHLNLSVDISPDVVPLVDDAAFFHAGLAAYCDELVLMAYDEHWSTDQTPGPVADVPWVEQAVGDMLDTGVPADKLVLGIPFYTRFWYVHRDGSVTSTAVADSAVSGILQSHRAASVWNSKLGVAVAHYPKPDGYEAVWYETDETLARKLALVKNQGLAGVAVWSLQLSDEHTWSVLLQTLRQSVS